MINCWFTAIHTFMTVRIWYFAASKNTGRWFDIVKFTINVYYDVILIFPPVWFSCSPFEEHVIIFCWFFVISFYICHFTVQKCVVAFYFNVLYTDPNLPMPNLQRMFII